MYQFGYSQLYVGNPNIEGIFLTELEDATILLQDTLESILPCCSRLPAYTPLLGSVCGIKVSTLLPPIIRSITLV